jgi:hypothetical protein
MEIYNNYELQRATLPKTGPFRKWRYEIKNLTTGRKFTFEAHIKDSLELNLMPPEDLQKDVERQIKWYLNQGMEGNRILKFQHESQNSSVQFIGDKTCK